VYVFLPNCPPPTANCATLAVRPFLVTVTTCVPSGLAAVVVTVALPASTLIVVFAVNPSATTVASSPANAVFAVVVTLVLAVTHCVVTTRFAVTVLPPTVKLP